MENKKAVVKKEKKEVVWAGAQVLFEKYGTEQNQYGRNSILLVAKALNITPFGVNVLGGLPYINNLGLKQKLSHYSPDARFEYRWIKRSENDTDKAICEARLMEKEVAISDWITGEASPASIKMGTLKGYQNHLAQTRAENRCINSVYKLKIHLDLFEGVA